MLHAVWLVLVGSDCGGQPSPRTSASEPKAPEEMTVVAIGPTAPDAGETAASNPVATAPLPPPPRDPRAVCQSYRAGAKPPQPYVQKVTGETVRSEEVILTDEGVRVGGHARLATRNPHPTVEPYCGRRPEGFELPLEGADGTLSPGELLSRIFDARAPPRLPRGRA